MALFLFGHIPQHLLGSLCHKNIALSAFHDFRGRSCPFILTGSDGLKPREWPKRQQRSPVCFSWPLKKRNSVTNTFRGNCIISISPLALAAGLLDEKEKSGFRQKAPGVQLLHPLFLVAS